MSLRDQILAADDIESEIVPVPQWSVEVEVRGMSGTARATFLQSYTNEDGSVNWSALYPSLLIATVHDPATGERVFQDGDEDVINAKSGAALEKVAKVALRLSGMEQNAEEEAGKSS